MNARPFTGVAAGRVSGRFRGFRDPGSACESGSAGRVVYAWEKAAVA